MSKNFTNKKHSHAPPGCKQCKVGVRQPGSSRCKQCSNKYANKKLAAERVNKKVEEAKINNK